MIDDVNARIDKKSTYFRTRPDRVVKVWSTFRLILFLKLFFLAAKSSSMCGLIILIIQMAGMNGILKAVLVHK
jgi:hypothetical protein